MNRTSLFLLSAALGGCSLANTFDELTQAVEAGATGGATGSGGSGDGGTGGGGSGGDDAGAG
ncbi:MAG: hypothetical protein FJ104_14255, partial [Deltaproteobacteria bacterium]|nr:hypothetical protein [Deltaproteobacteria bacterium]